MTSINKLVKAIKFLASAIASEINVGNTATALHLAALIEFTFG
mgnify:CR=1 FL=1